MRPRSSGSDPRGPWVPYVPDSERPGTYAGSCTCTAGPASLQPGTSSSAT